MQRIRKGQSTTSTPGSSKRRKYVHAPRSLAFDFEQEAEEEAEETFPVESLKLWEDGTDGVWFLIKWVLCKEMTLQHRDNFPRTKACCLTVYTRRGDEHE